MRIKNKRVEAARMCAIQALVTLGDLEIDVLNNIKSQKRRRYMRKKIYIVKELINQAIDGGIDGEVTYHKPIRKLRIER